MASLVVGAAGALQLVNGFRLTLETGVPVSTSDQTAATTVFLTPFEHSAIAVFDGSSEWVVLKADEVSLALGTLVDATNYDVFAFNSSGVLTLEIGTAWTSDIARASGDGAVSRQDGVFVKTNTTTRRLVGTIRMTSTTTTEDSESKRFTWNANNRGITMQVWA